MAYTVTLLQDQPPILLLDIEGVVRPPDMASHLDSIEALLVAQGLMETPIYLIVEVLGVDMSFSDVLKGAKVHATPRRGSSGDPLTTAMFVGTQPMIALLRDLFVNQNGKVMIPLFHERAAALEYIHTHYRQRTQGA